MFTINDFSTIFCVSKRTMERKVAKHVLLLKKFDTSKKKHFYTLDEAKYMINCLGIPPDTEKNRQILRSYPDLF